MGAFFSVEDNFSFFFCGKHADKSAEAFCFTHKELICMSCIVQNVHNGTDCNIREIKSVDLYPIQCAITKSCLKQNSVVQYAETAENDIQAEIEDAYSEALKHLEEYKSASYKVTRSEVTKLITRKRNRIAQQRHKLDVAIDYFLSGNLIEGHTILREIMNRPYSPKITFQTEIPFSDTEEKSLVHVKEFIDQENDDGWSELCRHLSKVHDFKSDIESVVDSDDPDDVVDDIAQLFEDKSKPA